MNATGTAKKLIRAAKRTVRPASNGIVVKTTRHDSPASFRSELKDRIERGYMLVGYGFTRERDSTGKRTKLGEFECDWAINPNSDRFHPRARQLGSGREIKLLSAGDAS